MAERGYASLTISEVLDGYNQATVMLYARGASSPAKPSSAITYTFETGALAGVPSSWSRNIPTANGYPCWVIMATPISQESLYSIQSTEWSTASKMVEDGDDAYTVMLNNESHTFVGDTTKAVAASITVGVLAFKGTTQVAASIGTITGQVTGLTTTIQNNNSLTAAVKVDVTTSLTTQGGTLTIPITVDAITVNKVFSWTLKLNGKDGTRGATWFSGTGITGTSTTPTIFSGSGVSSALVGDHYLNSSTQNIYVCTTAGSASVAKWKYEENIKGATGKGITSITPQYYLSTSSDSQVGGSWEDAPQLYQVGRFYWTRSHIVWTDGSTTDTTATLDQGLNSANSNAEYARLHAEPSLGMKINYSTFSTADSGEVYLHGYTNSAPADVNGYIMWNGVERTVSKGMINPNTIVPYNRYIYIVLRLTSASSTSGTLYMVWYNSGWKYAVTPTPTAVGGTWTWDEAKDIVLGQFIEPGSEQDLVEAYLYNPPRTPAQVKTTNVSPYQYSQSAVEWYNSNGQTTVNANTMLAAWADGAFSATTEIDGGYIKAHTIQTEHLATDAIMSNNFDASDDPSSPFSAAGTFLDLTTGNLYSPNFGIDNTNGEVFLNGEIIATSGRIGNSGASNYWEIGTKVDYNQAQSAAIIGHGTSYIQSGEWQLSNNRLDSRSYNAQNQITYPYANSTYYDFGINMPTLDVTLDPTSPNYSKGVDDIGHNDNFIYIRTAENSIPSRETLWNYVFRIDKNGMIWINGHSLDDMYAAKGSGSAYIAKNPTETWDNTITGNLKVTGQLDAIADKAKQLTHSLTINGTAWDGSTSTTIGTMGVAYGGTGRNTLTSGSALIGNGTSAVNFRAITNNTSATYITANDNLITANTLKFWKGSYDSSNNSNIEYVKLGKLGTAAIHAVEDFITVGGGVIDGSLSVTDLTAGSLVVNGAARFVNGAIGDLTGNASTATTLATARTIQTNLASTSAASFNGSANVTPGVTGTLGVANGGTGQTSAINATNAFLNALSTGSSTPVDADYYISQYVGGGTTTTTYHRRPMSALWAYINGKIGSVLGLTASNYDGNAATASNAYTADSATTATTATTADKVAHSIKIQLNGGTTEGTNQFTFNGSANKSFSITKSSIGLGNVDNTADVNKSVASASKISATRSFTVGDATKNVDWSGAVSFSKSEISGNATNAADGWMSHEDKEKLDQINISDIGVIGANTIVGDKDINVSIVNGIATVGHANSAITAGTASGTATSTLTNGGSFNIPSITYDAYGHITAKGSTTLTLPNITCASIGALPISGGTMTGGLTLKASLVYEANSPQSGLNANNSDIIGLNGLYFADTADYYNEGIHFYRDSTHYDSLHAYNGVLYFTPYRPKMQAGESRAVMSTPNYERGTTDYAIRPLVSQTRSNRLAFLPGDQVIIEKTTDGGATWVDAGYTDAQKAAMFNGVNGRISIPLLNGEKSLDCGLRVTITAMKYNVPSGTAETNKYNYWNSNYVASSERYFNVREWWFWLSSNSDTIGVTIEKATGVASTTWQTVFDKDFRMNGWSGSDWIRAGGGSTFGGNTSQTGNFWNWRLTFWSRYADNKTAFQSASPQSIETIYCFGDNIWGKPNNLMANDHLYSWDNNKNATFPAQVTATQFNGTATKATQDGSGNNIVDTYINKSNGFNLYSRSDIGTSPNYDNPEVNGFFELRSSSEVTGETGTRPYNGFGPFITLKYQNVMFQMAGTNVSGLYWRGKQEANATMSGVSWLKLLDSSNYNSYAPTLTGTGASGTWNINITGNAAKDSDGNTIKDTYVNLTGTQTISGAKTFSAMPVASAGLSVGNSGTAGGLSLWPDKNIKQYGLALRTTSDSGLHGYVQGDYATYFYMYAANAFTFQTRGWIFKDSVNNTGVASISGAGNAAFNGSVTIGANTDNTSGCRLVMDNTLKCLNFVFA